MPFSLIELNGFDSSKIFVVNFKKWEKFATLLCRVHLKDDREKLLYLHNNFCNYPKIIGIPTYIQ